ncbi:MAG TPA: hypothetical protein VGC45_06820 [Gryllotalpicola sp.]
MSARLPRAALRAGAALLAAATAVTAASCTMSGPVSRSILTVDLGHDLRPVTHVGSGGLYALATATDPARPLIAPLHLNQLTQPPPGVRQLGNGASTPTGDALKVAASAASVGAKIYIRMPDIYSDFPYHWVSWDDWLGKVRAMVEARLADPAATSIDGWELWNEPDWTWDTAHAGDFDSGWVRSYRAVRALDPTTPIVGPSFSEYDPGEMADFLANAKATNTIPDTISWHELAAGTSGWSDIGSHVADYRALEKSLGIGPLPISVNEYAAKDAIDSPSGSLHFLAQFERAGVANAARAYWYESGTIGGLIWQGRPTGVYWLYDWYGSMDGRIVAVTPSAGQDGVASYDGHRHIATVLVGGEGGTNTIRITGASALGAHVSVSILRTDATGRHQAMRRPVPVEKTHVRTDNGTVTVMLDKQMKSSAYEIVIASTPP